MKPALVTLRNMLHDQRWQTLSKCFLYFANFYCNFLLKRILKNSLDFNDATGRGLKRAQLALLTK